MESPSSATYAVAQLELAMQKLKQENVDLKEMDLILR